MSKPWRLTRQAEASLVGIARWTLETFGPRQAAAYEDDLIARCNEIAAGTAPSQSCGYLAEVEAAEDLRFTRAGQHFIVFVEDDRQFVITDFLHAKSDLSRRLAALSEPRRDD